MQQSKGKEPRIRVRKEQWEDTIMRKRWISTLAAGAAAVLMLSGFDSAMTVDQLQENAKDALAQVTSLSASMSVVADAGLNMKQNTENGASMDVPINGTGDVTLQLNMEPLQLGMTVNYDWSAMGQGMNGSMEMYVIENEDGTGAGYMGNTVNGQTQWSAGTAGTEEVSQMKEAVQAVLRGDMSAVSTLSPDANVDAAAMNEILQQYQDVILDMTQIAPQSATVSGKECYQLTADITGDSLYPFMADALSASGAPVDDSSLPMVQAVMSSMRIKADSLFDVQTCLPVSASIDLGESDFSAIGDMIVSSMAGTAGDMTAAFDVNALKMTADFAFNEPVTITVPEEALNAASESDSTGTDTDVNPEDLIGGLLGSDTGTSDGGTGVEEDAPVQNADGSYRIEYEDYLGNLDAADVAVPDGLALTYGSGAYLTFSNDDYSRQVSYSLFSRETPQETVESDLDTSYYESDSSYSDITRTEVMQTALADGTPVYYGFREYTYNGYSMGGTVCALQVGDVVVKFEIELEDQSRNTVPASEQEVQTYAAVVKPAA